MPDPLAVRVAERLDIRPEQTDRVLRTLAQLVRKQSTRDGRVRVPGLGVFRQSGEALTFEPDRKLAEAVNARYAALEPILLSVEEAPSEAPFAEAEPAYTSAEAPPFPLVPEPEEDAAEASLGEDETPAAEAPLPEPEVTVPPAPEQAAFPGEASEEPPSEEPSSEDVPFEEEPATEEEALNWAPVGTRWSGERPDELEPVEASEEVFGERPGELEPVEAFEEAFGERPGELEPAEAFGERPGELEPVEAFEEAVEGAEPQNAPEVVSAVALQPRAADLPPKPPARTVKPKRAPEGQRSLFPWLLLIAFLVITSIAAYFYLRTESGPLASSNEPAQPTDVREPIDAATDENASPEEATPSEGVTPSEEAAPAAAEPAPQEAGGGQIDRAAGGYTLVVGSRRSRAPAEEAAARFRRLLEPLSIPVDLLEGTAGDGSTRYRVTVGQAPSIEEAMALKERLGDQIPADAWVTRIQLEQ